MKKLYNIFVNVFDCLFRRKECPNKALDMLGKRHDRLSNHPSYQGGLVPAIVEVSNAERPETYARTAVRRVEDEVIERLRMGFGI